MTLTSPRPITPASAHAAMLYLEASGGLFTYADLALSYHLHDKGVDFAKVQAIRAEFVRTFSGLTQYPANPDEQLLALAFLAELIRTNDF